MAAIPSRGPSRLPVVLIVLAVAGLAGLSAWFFVGMAMSMGPLAFLADPGPPLDTVSGPETLPAEVLMGTLLVATESHRDLTIHNLETATLRKVTAQGRVWQIAGPDRAGRLLYAEQGGAGCRLMLIEAGADEGVELLERGGAGAFYRQSLFRNLSLSTTGGRFAFASDRGREWGTPQTERRIAELDTGRFRTVLPYVGRFQRYSVGVVAP